MVILSIQFERWVSVCNALHFFSIDNVERKKRKKEKE